MMQFLLLGFVVLLLLLFAKKKYEQADPKDMLYSMRWFFAGAVLLFVLFLVATGKFQLIWLALLSAYPWVRRFLMARQIYKKFKGDSSQSSQQENSQGDDQRRQQNNTYPSTRLEALEVLNLKPGASESEINKAHRELMKKHHPDTGGSVDMAARINRAKDILLP